jgi:thioredoxin reductase
MRAEWDAVIAGGGSAGLAAALTLSRALRRTLVIDGGRQRNAAAAHSHGVPGFDGDSPRSMLERVRAEIVRFGGEIRDDEVVSATRRDDLVELRTASGARLDSRTVIVATGVVDELPAVPGVSELWGSAVVICPYCDGWEVRGKRIAILGTGPKSIHQANLLRQWSDAVTVFTNAVVHPTGVELAEFAARGIRTVDGVVKRIDRAGDGVVLETSAGTTEFDIVFTAPRAIPEDRLLAELGAEFVDTPVGRFARVDARGATSTAGVWAVGNVVNPSLKVATAAGNGMDVGTHVNEALVRADIALALEPNTS